jgi:uncharacterized membrane protein
MAHSFAFIIGVTLLFTNVATCIGVSLQNAIEIPICIVTATSIAVDDTI